MNKADSETWSITMNDQELKQLQAHIREYGKQYDVEARVWIEDMEKSDVTPAGPRIQMSVIRRIEGHPAREHPHNVSGYRPDAPDLRARLESVIKDAARALYATP
jgi:hypothetical protein